MNKNESKNTKGIVLSIGAGFFLFLAVIYLFAIENTYSLFAGYGIGFLAIGLHYIISLFSMTWENKTFFALYTPLSLLRILLVLGIFVGMIIWGKLDQFSFTVSFLISYIYHSVINIFLLNKRSNKPTG